MHIENLEEAQQHIEKLQSDVFQLRERMTALQDQTEEAQLYLRLTEISHREAGQLIDELRLRLARANAPIFARDTETKMLILPYQDEYISELQASLNDGWIVVHEQIVYDHADSHLLFCARLQRPAQVVLGER